MRYLKVIRHTLLAISILTFSSELEIAHAQTTSSISKKQTPQERLDNLFGKLKREPNERKAKFLAANITRTWADSGSPTANALMAWANQAINDKRYGAALDLLDQVITLVPDYAEGWNRRATLHYLMRSPAKSMADIERTLAIEPRHFGAISGMASILALQGADDKALKAYEQVLSVYPANRAAQKKLIELLKKREKSEI